MNRFPSFAVLSSVAWLLGCGTEPRVIHTGDVDLAVEVRDSSAPPRVDMAMSPCGMCAAPTPLCDPKGRRCVACLTDNDCPENAICKLGACMFGCSAQHGACGDAGSCDTDMGLCHGCLRDRDCADPKLPYCELASGRCIGCDLQNDRCPPGTWCAAAGGGTSQCIPGCKVDVDCQVGVDGGGASFLCCNHACIDTGVSAKNCGACGIDCNGGACCSGRCASTQNDVKNCGACGKVCLALNAVPLCVAGVCAVGGCLMGFADCNGAPNDGCEVNVGGDPGNCGACGKVCNLPNSNPLCLGGVCTNGGCKPGFRDCDGNVGNGCEVNVNVDPMNCGVCGQSCKALPHSSAGCQNGVCAVMACDAGYGNCDKVDVNGCESPLAADPMNCGACGKVCPAPPNVVTGCANSVCSMGGCLQGYSDCNNNMNDGCEARLATDAKNCGGCGKVCPAPANGTAGCAGGMCGVGACNNGYGDCDMNAGNGCEANLNNDASNCGACGKVCPNGTPCANGMCGCVPNGRAPFNMVQSKTANGCWMGNPCQYDVYAWDATHGINFQAFGQQITCVGNAPACVANIGITTYQSAGGNTCQGWWDVYCDNVMVGTIKTLNGQCIGTAMGGTCKVSFGARMCTTVQIVAAQDGDNTAGCCGSPSPDSMVTAISAW